MKKLILISLMLIPFAVFSQNKLLTKKIVYSVPIVQTNIHNTIGKDSISYNYLVNRRFWWEAIDNVLQQAKNKTIVLHNFHGDTIAYDSMINNLNRQLTKSFKRTFSKKEIQDVFDNEIREIKFEEQWTYNTNTMLIDKVVTAFCPVITRDSVAYNDQEIKAEHGFAFDIGWIYPKSNKNTNDTTLICRNIQYTIPIYNQKPYKWWDNNLEAEYSIPYFSLMLSKAEKGEVLTFEDPNSAEAFTKPNVVKRREMKKVVPIYKTDKNNEEQINDTTVVVRYEVENIDCLRFGEEIYFDKSSCNFIKNTNYVAPIIRIYSDKGEFRGFYPLYYIRKK